MRERERDRETERDRQTDMHAGRQTDRPTADGQRVKGRQEEGDRENGGCKQGQLTTPLARSIPLSEPNGIQGFHSFRS